MKKLISILLITGMTGFSCTSDKGPVFPQETGQVNFETQVLPIFENNCISCHNTQDAVSNGHLDLSAVDAYNNLVNVESWGYAPAVRVVPEHPDQSVLFSKIQGDGNFGSTMPLGGHLSENEIEMIEKWINQGAHP